MVDGTPEVIFGIRRTDTLGVACPWLLATDFIKKVPYSFTKLSRLFLVEWLKEYPILTNIVDARNTLHVRWLRLMGFTFIKDYPESGPGRILAKQFVKVGDS